MTCAAEWRKRSMSVIVVRISGVLRSSAMGLSEICTILWRATSLAMADRCDARRRGRLRAGADAGCRFCGATRADGEGANRRARNRHANACSRQCARCRAKNSFRKTSVPRATRIEPLPIGHDQTISQPLIVAFMTEQLRPQPRDRVLEIGTGSGYQAAILAELVAEVYSIEIVEPLAKTAKATLQRLGYKNVHVESGRRLQRLAEARAVRCHHRDLRARSRAAAAGRSIERRRAHDHPRGRKWEPGTLSLGKEKRPSSSDALCCRFSSCR